MAPSYATPSQFSRSVTRSGTPNSTMCVRVEHALRGSPLVVALCLIVFLATIPAAAYYGEPDKISFTAFWEKRLAENVLQKNRDFYISLSNASYDSQRNYLLVTYEHAFYNELGKLGSRLVTEVLDCRSGRSVGAFVCPEEGGRKGPTLIVLPSRIGVYSNSLAVTCEEEDVLLLINGETGLTLETYDMTSGVQQARLELVRRESFWTAIHLPVIRKVYLFDPVKKIKIDKEADTFDWEYDVFEVQASKRSIELRKIVSFRSRRYSTVRLYVCPTCSGRKLAWIQHDGKQDLLEIYDPIMRKFEGPPRILPSHVAAMIRNDGSINLVPILWLDEQNWRWFQHTPGPGPGQPGDKLTIWDHQEKKPIGTICYPRGIHLSIFDFDANGNLHAAFGNYETHILDTQRIATVAKVADDKPKQDQKCRGGLLSPDGNLLFRFIEEAPTVLKVKVYKRTMLDR
jgi:hypothetical protein